MPTEQEELLDFLGDPKPEVRRMAADIVRGLSGSEEGVAALTAGGSKQQQRVLASRLMALLLDDLQDIASSAADAAVNISAQNPDIAAAFVEEGGIRQAVKLLLRAPPVAFSSALVMLLANLTQSEQGSRKMLSDASDADATSPGSSLRRLVRLFCKSAQVPASSGEESRAAAGGGGEASQSSPSDPWQHFAAVLSNVARASEGRDLLLDSKHSLMKQLLLQSDSENVVRREGIASMLKNVCFEASSHLPALLAISDFLWPALLLPLAGRRAYSESDLSLMPTELSAPLSAEREGESSAAVRRDAADAVYLIALEEGGQRALWAVNGPRILQVGYEEEENPEVMESFERLGALLVDNGMGAPSE